MEHHILINEINQRNEEAWKRLFDYYYAPLCCYSERYCNSHEEAEDTVQDTLVSIWNRNVQFKDEQHLTFYLYKSVYNNSLSKVRDAKKVVELTPDMFLEWTDDDFAVTIREEMHRRMWEEIQKLPHRRRSVIMRAIEGKSLKEIADELDISISTVKETKAKAIKELRKTIKREPLLFLL